MTHATTFCTQSISTMLSSKLSIAGPSPRNKFINFFVVFSIIFAIPSFAKESLFLTGKQEKKELTVDLSRTDLAMDSAYLIPEGCTLTLLGSGKIEAKSKAQVIGLDVRGTLKIGNPKTKLRNLKDVPLIDLGMRGFIAITAPTAKMEVNNCALQVGTLGAVGGKLSCNYVALTTTALNFASAAEIKLENCSLRCEKIKSVIDQENPEALAKHVQFNNCVFVSPNPSVDIRLLWCMNKCDLYGRCITMSVPRDMKATSPVKNVYFADKEFLETLQRTMKFNFEGFSVSQVSGPYNTKLGVETEEKTVPKKSKQ